MTMDHIDRVAQGLTNHQVVRDAIAKEAQSIQREREAALALEQSRRAPKRPEGTR